VGRIFDIDIIHRAELYGALKRTPNLKLRDIKENDEIPFQVMKKFTGKVATVSFQE